MTDSGIDSGSACTPTSPAREICDGIDTDCDGQLDPDDCQPGLVAWYRFEEDTGEVLDSSGNGWDGIGAGGLVFGDAGAVGSGLRFVDGMAGITVPDGPVMDASAGWTLEVWVALTPPVTGFHHILAMGDPTMCAEAILDVSSAGMGQFAGFWGACDGFGAYPLQSMPLTLDGSFIHLAFSYDGTTFSTLVNGVTSSSSVNMSPTFGAWLGPLTLGALPPVLGLIGAIDEVKLWEGVRAEADVCSDAHGTYDPGPPGSCLLP